MKSIASEVFQSEFVTNDNLIPCGKCGNQKIGGCGSPRKNLQGSPSTKYEFDCVHCDPLKIEYETPNYTHVRVVLDAFINALPPNERPADVLFVIVTDGEDTGGRFDAEDAKRKIRRRREEQDWKFVLLAMGVDVNSVAAKLGISPSEAIVFNREKAGDNIQEIMNVNIANIRVAQNSRKR